MFAEDSVNFPHIDLEFLFLYLVCNSKTWILELKLTDIGEIVQSLVNAEEVHVDMSGYVLLNESLLLYLVTTWCPVVPVTAWFFEWQAHQNNILFSLSNSNC
jgi:hypothetical protein